MRVLNNGCQRPIEGLFPYAYLDGIVLKRTWAQQVRNISVLVAIGVDSQGFRSGFGCLRRCQRGQVWLEQLSQTFEKARS